VFSLHNRTFVEINYWYPCSSGYTRVGRVWGPADALYDMVMLSEVCLHFFSSNRPHNYSLQNNQNN